MLPTLLVKGNLMLHDGTDFEPEPDITPIDYITGWIKKRSPKFGSEKFEAKDRVLMVQAETGSGKSTVMPTEIYRLFRNKLSSSEERSKARVICTQPRILTTIDIVNKLVMKKYNYDLILGNRGVIGYATGISNNSPPCGLTYATLGVLIEKINNMSDQEFIDYYDVIIIDEAHERDIALDMALLSLKNIYTRNKTKRLPFLIITSATFDAVSYVKFFELSHRNIVRVKGSSYKKTITWYDGPKITNYLLTAVELTLKLNASEMEGDILIFVPIVADALKLKELFDEIAAISEVKLNILILDGPRIKRNHLDFTNLNDTFNKNRKVIISNVVAETGITLENLKFVIDCGYSKVSETYHPYNISCVAMKPITKSKVHQRMGRVGRESDGYFYPLYSEDIYDLMEEYSQPDIASSGIESIYLKLVIEQQKNKLYSGKLPDFNLDDLSLLDFPSVENVWVCNTKAFMNGFISPNTMLPSTYPFDLDDNIKIPANPFGYGITRKGVIASKFSRINMEEAALLFNGIEAHLSITDLITLIAFRNTNYERLFARKKGDFPVDYEAINEACPDFLKEKGVDFYGERLSVKELTYLRVKVAYKSDFIISLLIFNKFVEETIKGSEQEWCTKFGINLNTLNEIISGRIDIINDIIVANVNIFKFKSDLTDGHYINKMRSVINKSYNFNVLTKHKTNYKHYTGVNVKIEPYVDYKILKKSNIKFEIQNITTNYISLTQTKSELNLYEITSGFTNVLDVAEHGLLPPKSLPAVVSQD